MKMLLVLVLSGLVGCASIQQVDYLESDKVIFITEQKGKKVYIIFKGEKKDIKCELKVKNIKIINKKE